MCTKDKIVPYTKIEMEGPREEACYRDSMHLKTIDQILWQKTWVFHLLKITGVSVTPYLERKSAYFGCVIFPGMNICIKF